MSTAAVRLDVVAGNATGTSILVYDELLIGRDVEGSGRLADDEEISRAHARVTLGERGSCGIEDLGSTNGTFVNGVRISGPKTLAEGDTVELGATTIVVREVSRPIVEEVTKQTVLNRPLGPDLDQAAETAEPVAVEPPRKQISAEPAEPAAAKAPRLSLRLEVDFAGTEARIWFDESSEPVRLVYEAGSWRPVAVR